MAMTRHQQLLGGVGGHCPSFSHWVLLLGATLFTQRPQLSVLATSAPTETGQQPAILAVNIIHGVPDHLQERERRIIGQRIEALEPHFIGREPAVPTAYLQYIDGDGPSSAEDDLLALALDSYTRPPGRPRVVLRIAAGSNGMAATLVQALSPYAGSDDVSLVLLVSGLDPHQRALVQQVGLEFPLATKLVLLGGGGPDLVDPDECPNETELQSVRDLLSALWRTGQVTHLAVAWYRCPAGDAPLIALFDPFAHPLTHDSSRWGAFRLMKEREPVNLPNGGQHLNLNRMPIDILGFEAAMAYRRKDIEMMPRTFPAVWRNGGSDQSDIEDCGGDSPPYQDTLFGADVDALRELAHRMNFSACVRYESGNFGFRTANGTFTGVLGGLLAHRTWLSMNVYFLKDYETRDLLFSAAVYQDSLCVFVQAAGMLPNWLLIFRCFSPTLWISVCGTVVIVTVCYIVLSGLVGRSSAADPDSGLQTVLMGQIVSAMLNAPVTRLEATTGHQKLYIAFGLIWGLTLTGAFQGSLVNVYTTPRSMRNLDTLAELDASRLSITVTAPALIVDVFGTEQPGQNTLGNLKSRLVIQLNPTGQQVGSAVVAGRTAGLIRNQDFGRLLTKHLIADGTSQVHRLGECPRSYTLAYLYPRGSPLYRVANGHLLRFLQHGLYAKWQSDAAHVLAMNHALKVRQLRARQLAAHLLDLGEGRMALRLDHLLLPFMLLSGGLAIGTVCLLGERYLLRQPSALVGGGLFRIGRHRVRDKTIVHRRRCSQETGCNMYE